MEYVRFGSTGMKVSQFCLGCMTYGSPDWREWVLDERASRPFIKQALDKGINFFDTADMYSLGRSEEVLGRSLLSMVPRDEVVIASKVGLPLSDKPNDRGLSRKHILSSIDASLKRLGTDYLDLYIIHRLDPETSFEETIEALDTVVKSGKARYIGASSMYAWQFMRMLDLQERYGLAKFVSMQNHYNLIYREEEREMLPLCREMGIALTPWSPLARGLLAGTRKQQTVRNRSDQPARLWYDQPSDEDNIIASLELLASRRGVSAAQIALAWVASRPGVTAPIIGASKPHHLEDAVASLKIVLTDEEVGELEAAYKPRAVAGLTM
ncbi:aldo/keto reductase [Neisseriaceae bacterium TC5R-5]|nr:aldo/keto reductase [Neisseriaceae bacterium TC5R-5]